MNEIEFVKEKDKDHAKKILESYYGMIPRDKKPYLTDLKSSLGPYMGLATGESRSSFLLDVSSQIATLGHGFNPACSFGTSHFLDSWINESGSKSVLGIVRALRRFLKRKTGRRKLYLKFCHSGAEANETALGYCFERRVNRREANQILAFEGSFHGRMMASLMATWNPAKREPFEWSQFSAHYCPYPQLGNDKIRRIIPHDWRRSWDMASSKKFRVNPSWGKVDGEIRDEIECLFCVRKALLSRRIFAIIVEPMQCEGGDRFSSDRFHTALVLMAQSFSVPIVYDEVQTGFHLGRDFFWHRDFKLKGLNGKTLYPDYITCAKKAQVGMVLSSIPHGESEEPPCVASLIRGYHQGILLDQKRQSIEKIEKKVKSLLEKLVMKHNHLIENPRGRGLSFAFDLRDKKILPAFVEVRFTHGLLYYPAGERTLRFRLNVSFSEGDMEFLFNKLDIICSALDGSTALQASPAVSLDRGEAPLLYRWSSFLFKIKYHRFKGTLSMTVGDVCAFFKEITGKELAIVDRKNFPQYEKKIMELQKKVYEPARVAPIETFQRVVDSRKGWGLVVLEEKTLLAMSFASLITDHPLERGVKKDPFFNDPETIYCIDTTLNPDSRGQRLGLSLKYALYALGLVEGIERIQGRNRERLASSMLAINLSLGAYEIQYLKEDYPASEKNRDTLYYTMKIAWEKEKINLSNAINAPLGSDDLDCDYIEEQLPPMVNKICLSNFVSERFLSLVSDVFSLMPAPLRHGYSCSGQSECVDKIAKSLWFKSNRKTHRMLSFEGHFFGTGSLLARSLSGGGDPFFHVDRLEGPTEENQERLLRDVALHLERQNYLALWIEPLPQKTMVEVPRSFLVELKKLCSNHAVKIIYNETASQCYRYGRDHFFVSNDSDLVANGCMVYTGGQNAFVALEESCFTPDPLLLISTWDGDEFSLANYRRAVFKIRDEKEKYMEVRENIERKLTDHLKNIQTISFHFKEGRGIIRGTLPRTYAKYFNKTAEGHYLLCPAYSHMVRFLEKIP